MVYSDTCVYIKLNAAKKHEGVALEIAAISS